MSLSSTATARDPGRGPARLATAIAVAVAVLAPLAVLCALVWSSTSDARGFSGDERSGGRYLEPLTELLGATTQAQSAAVRGRTVDAAGVRTALAAVDRMDASLGGALQTTDRWTTVRATVQERVSRTGWPQPSAAYTQYSDLNTALLELIRTVGDNSRLILDPSIDSYYVMNATLLRIPEILVDSGRYADLSVLSATGGATDATSDATAQAQLTAARNRIATDATDLSDGLVKAFAQTSSSTLGPGLTRQLDNFRTAVDAVAPSTSLLAPAPDRSLSDLAGDQTALLRAALDLQRAALGELDRLLADRAAHAQRMRIIGIAAAVVGVLVAAGLALLLWRRPLSPPRTSRHAQPEPQAVPHRPVNGTPMPVRTEPPGGARAAR
jgi:hypothetical protein